MTQYVNGASQTPTGILQNLAHLESSIFNVCSIAGYCDLVLSRLQMFTVHRKHQQACCLLFNMPTLNKAYCIALYLESPFSKFLLNVQQDILKSVNYHVSKCLRCIINPNRHSAELGKLTRGPGALYRAQEYHCNLALFSFTWKVHKWM